MNLKECGICVVANCPFKKGFNQTCQVPMVKNGLKRFWHDTNAMV